MKRQRGLTCVIVAVVSYLSLPVVFWQWLTHELEAGSFPVYADSIGLPMAGFVLVWLVGFVIFPVLVIVAESLRKPGSLGK